MTASGELPTPNQSYKILLVDDDENLLFAANALLVTKGYDVHIAKTGAEAIRISKRKKFHLAIIDINLPDMSGVDLLKLFKVSCPGMRKVIMTGFATKDNAIRAVNYGADLFLTKPVDLNDFTKAIEDQLEKQLDGRRGPSLAK